MRNNVIKTIAYMIRHPRKTYRVIYTSQIRNKGLYDSAVKDISKLDALGIKHQTDKSSAVILEDQIANGNNYLKYYELLFKEKKNKPINILEFGCQGGNSLRLWYDYFPKAKIIGVDLDEKCKKYENDRTTVIVGNSVSEKTKKLIIQNKIRFDIIIDDASHAWGEQRYILENYWTHLVGGGYLVVEDLGCGAYGAYAEKGYVPELIDGTPFFDYIQDISTILRWENKSRKNHLKEYDEYSEEYREIIKTIEMMMCIPGAVILKKDIT